MTRPLRRGVQLLLVVTVLGACSGNGETVPSTAAAQGDLTDLVVSLSEWRFAPANGFITADEPAAIELRNTGTVRHEFAVIDGHVETEADLEDVVILARLAVNAGEVKRLETPALAAGVYEVVCPIPGHIANGMVGTLTVGG